jgi:hypothetical protein
MTEPNVDPSRFRAHNRSSANERDYRSRMLQYIAESPGTLYEKFENFPKYLSRQALARFLSLYEIFKLALPVHGDVIECGVNWGGGLMSFALMSATLEPVNLQRRVVGFDTFSGFAEISKEDAAASHASEFLHQGGLTVDSYDDLKRCIELYDSNRFIGHLSKVILVKGDATITIPKFIEENPHTIVSLLHLDFDLFAPTVVALQHFLPRMPRGAVIVFDELNSPVWPGETRAVLATCGLQNLRIQRFPFEPHVSYAVIE